MGFSDASSGTFLVSTNSTPNTVDCVGFKCDTDVTLSDLQADDNIADIRTSYMDSDTATLPAGAIIRIRSNIHSKFTSITTASGTITKIL